MFSSLAAEHLVVGIYLLEDGRFRYVNERLAQMLGYSREALLGKRLQDIVTPSERHNVHETIQRALRGESVKEHYERKAVRRDGSTIDVEIFGSRFSLNGKPMIASVVVDATDRKSMEAEAQFSSMVYYHSAQAMVVTDAGGIILTANPAFSVITGYGLDEVRGRRLNILSSGRHDTAFYERMWQELIEHGTWEGDIWNRRKNGEVYVERLSINTTYNEDGTPRCRIGLFSDITEHKKEQEHIWQQARHDQLTGLPNRYMFSECLESKLAYANRAQTGLALLYLDLDFFKDVNDSLGHAQGDELLRQVAARLSKCARKTDLVARLGGDEFCIIADGMSDRAGIAALCAKVSHVLREPYQLGDFKGTISACIGAALYPDDASNAEELVHHADMAMYAAKRKGRNEYAFYESAMAGETQRRTLLSRELADALQDEQFTLHYQPILDLKTRRIAKLEALLRWNHPERGLLGPMQFVPQAEDSGLIVGIGEWVFRQATRMLLIWRRMYSPGLRITINVSLAQLMDERMRPEDWLAHLDTLKLPYDSVVIEITEKLLQERNPSVARKLDVFCRAGIRMALDDFGTGYSSVAYLKRMHLDYLKIDESFVYQAEARADQMALCDAVILMAHRLGLPVVAEGIATEAQLSLVTDLGCDFGQGMHFYSAIPAPQIEALLRTGG